MKHLVFYDGSCGLCDWVVQCLLKWDKQEQFAFAPLQGETAQKLLKDYPEYLKNLESLVLIENYQTQDRRYYFYGKGALRICWLLGRTWKLLGVLSFLPSIFLDGPYRLVARNRHRFFSPSCIVSSDTTKHRFLP